MPLNHTGMGVRFVGPEGLQPSPLIVWLWGSSGHEPPVVVVEKGGFWDKTVLALNGSTDMEICRN